MIYFLFLCFLPVVGEIGMVTKTYLEYVWPAACLIVGLDWCRQVCFSPSTVSIHPAISVSYFLLIATWGISLTGGLASNLLPPDAADLLNKQICEMFLTSTILIVSISAATNKLQLERIFKVIVFSSIPYAITIFFLGGEVESTGDVARRSGIFIDFGPSGTYMLFASILALALIRMKKGTILFLACILLFSSTLAMTLSKTSMVVLMVLIVLAPLLDFNWKLSAAMTLGAPIALLGALPLLPTSIIKALHQTFVSLFIDSSAVVAGQGGTFGDRIKHFWMGLELFQNYPILGCGLNRHLIIYPVFHVTYVTILSETGILGFMVFLLFIAIILLSGFRSLRTLALIGDRNGHAMMKALLLSFALVLLTWSTQPLRGQEERLFWLISGLIGGMEIWIRKEHKVNMESTDPKQLGNCLLKNKKKEQLKTIT